MHEPTMSTRRTRQSCLVASTQGNSCVPLLIIWDQSPIDGGGANKTKMLTGVDRFEQHFILTVPLLFSGIGRKVSAPSIQDHPTRVTDFGENAHSAINARVGEKKQSVESHKRRRSTHQRKTRESRNSTN